MDNCTKDSLGLSNNWIPLTEDNDNQILTTSEIFHRSRKATVTQDILPHENTTDLDAGLMLKELRFDDYTGAEYKILHEIQIAYKAASSYSTSAIADNNDKKVDTRIDTKDVDICQRNPNASWPAPTVACSASVIADDNGENVDTPIDTEDLDICQRNPDVWPTSTVECSTNLVADNDSENMDTPIDTEDVDLCQRNPDVWPASTVDSGLCLSQVIINSPSSSSVRINQTPECRDSNLERQLKEIENLEKRIIELTNEQDETHQTITDMNHEGKRISTVNDLLCERLAAISTDISFEKQELDCAREIIYYLHHDNEVLRSLCGHRLKNEDRLIFKHEEKVIPRPQTRIISRGLKTATCRTHLYNEATVESPNDNVEMMDTHNDTSKLNTITVTNQVI